MAKYETPTDLRPLEKMLRDFTFHNGFDIPRVFDDWLFFIIGNFNLKPKPEPWWKYTKEQNVEFHKMMVEWITIMDKKIERHEWYDVFGELYESCVASSGRRSNSGQFFTPHNICELMAAITYGNEIKPVGKNVSDPTCGSGRTLLSFHAHCPGNYLFAEDIDRTCCMMTVANFIVHGAVGEVIWHNSLMPESWNGGWKVNEYLNNSLSPYFGIPHMRPIDKEESALMQYWVYRGKAIAEKRRVELERNEQRITMSLPTGTANPIQLTLWG